jgi:hypothetical protein
MGLLDQLVMNDTISFNARGPTASSDQTNNLSTFWTVYFNSTLCNLLYLIDLYLENVINLQNSLPDRFHGPNTAKTMVRSDQTPILHLLSSSYSLPTYFFRGSSWSCLLSCRVRTSHEQPRSHTRWGRRLWGCRTVVRNSSIIIHLRQLLYLKLVGFALGHLFDVDT